MPPKKKPVANNAGNVPAGRRTRRQTMQFLANEQSESLDSCGVPESAPIHPQDINSTEPAENIIETTPVIEDVGVHHKIATEPELMAVDCPEEIIVNGTSSDVKSDSLPVPLNKSESFLENGPDLEVVAEHRTIAAMDTVEVANSETDSRLVNEIEAAITNIKIESEPVPCEIPVAVPAPVVKAEADCKEERESTCAIVSQSADLDNDDDSLSIRRSSRIKTISKTKQKSRGHGLVRDRDKIKLPTEGETPYPVPPPPPLDALPVPPPVSQDEPKPQKIKSRWLDSAKRESLDLCNSLNTGNDTESLSTSISTDPVGKESAGPTPLPSTPIDYYAPDPEVIECLKRLNQIKDNIYTCERNISKEAKKMVCDCFLTADEKQSGELGCGEDCLNRLLMIECGTRCVVGDRCTNRRFQKHLYAPVVVFKTEKKGFGLRAAAEIQAGEFIMEYVGEVLNAKQFDKRANAYSKVKNKHYYFMALRSDAVIDATGKGNISRFINHSCDPNAETQKWTVNGELRIGFFTTRSIGAGEEVTFDYQYQRYGKEAQKCYCEAETCRGWIGEEPDSDSDDEDEEDGEEGEEEDVEGEESDGEAEEESATEEGVEKGAQKEKGKKKGGRGTAKRKTKAAKQKKAKATARAKKTATTTATTKAPRKPRRTARSRRQEILDDLDLDAEIDALSKTGLKNQAHTLKLSRVMVRAKLPKTRMRLLELIQGGEVPCRRLFLDYHGLRLLHGWMSDAQEQRDGGLKMELLRTLHSLPIPNKTMLKESHVLTAVSNYGGLKLDSERKEIVAEEPPLPMPVFEKREKKVEEVLDEVKPEPMEVVKEEKEKAIVDNVESSSSVVTGENDVKMEVVDPEEVEKERKRIEEEAAEAKAIEEEEAEIRRVNLENEMRALCKEMVLKWVQLPEVFRIPKKERIEQMKEHEREADMRFMTLGLQNEDQEKINERRFKGKNPDDIKWVKREFAMPVNDGMSKNQRRRLFAMQVEEQRRMEQRMDTWRHHEFRCNFFGLDPFRVRPEDVPSWVDLENRQWFTYDLTEVPTPPNYVHVTMKAPEPEHADIADYDLPKLDLPEGWEYAMDPRGRLYYFHKKIRIPQWELPIKLLPLNQEQSYGKGESANGVHNGHFGGAVSDIDDDDDADRNEDSSTTDTCDSSEEETVRRINRVKKLQKIGVARAAIVKLHLHERNSDDEVTREEVSKAAEGKAVAASSSSSLFSGQSKKLLNREALVEYREISPRREEDRLYGQAEMKRYKETKEKFKQRKEMLKRRKLEKLMRAGVISSDADKRVSFRSITITDDELYDETDDEEEKGNNEARLNGGSPMNLPLDVSATTTVPLMEKIVLGNSRVDELDEPHKYNEMTRLKIRERNAKRSRALKVQMKLKRMKMDEEMGGEQGRGGAALNGMVIHHNYHPPVNGMMMGGGGGEGVEGGGTPVSAVDGMMMNGGDPRLSGGVNLTPIIGGTPIAGVPSGSSSISSEKAKRIKDKFRSNIAGVIVQHLSPYRRDSCPIGRITNNEDFKHLAKKLTHFVLVKELKHCATVADLSVSDSVKQKSKEFIRKYMSKYGKVYEKPANEPEY